MESRGASGVIFECDVDVSGSLVPDGAFAVLVDFDVGSSGSCTAASNEAAIVPSGCSSSTGCGRKEEKEKDVKRMQFFVNRGKGFTTVVRCSPDAVLSDVLQLDTDEYAVCGSRFVKVGAPSVRIRLGMVRMWKCCDGSVVVQAGQWECKVCHATRCWPARKRCYKCGAPCDAVLNNLPLGPLVRAPPQSRSSGPPTRSSGPRHVPPRNEGNGNEPLLGSRGWEKGRSQ